MVNSNRDGCGASIRPPGKPYFIQPQAALGEPAERFNWDAPILVSPHKPTRLYFASQRVWKSENRGDAWQPISKDLTSNQERLGLPIMGQQQSWDNAWDVNAMSNYNTITSLAESPLLWKDFCTLVPMMGFCKSPKTVVPIGAKWNWQASRVFPATAFVNDVRADLFDAGTVYAALDNHKYGDYRPYLIKSTDKGRTWSMMNGNLPQRLLTWRLVQDHIKKELLFAATEQRGLC